MDSLKPVKQHILWKKRAEMLQSRVDELEEENGLLKKQLEDKSAQEQGMYRKSVRKTCEEMKLQRKRRRIQWKDV
ncbi:hypothetical protein G5714_013893 [Onychostoma macrolepis]|uniref:Uncharacterized protein n=1 Tax=Onychostoma macrolepis TaxID=369639 RepID=A0A7J6CFH6_9TELE|nr:hypothetical protein G5714_013893 [Onychostoma macrolepis]